MKTLKNPKSEKQLKKLAGNRVTFIIALSLEELIDTDIESLNSLADETFIGDGASYCLSDINYRPTGIRKDGCILIEVDADLESFDY